MSLFHLLLLLHPRHSSSLFLPGIILHHDRCTICIPIVTSSGFYHHLAWSSYPYIISSLFFFLINSMSTFFLHRIFLSSLPLFSLFIIPKRELFILLFSSIDLWPSHTLYCIHSHTFTNIATHNPPPNHLRLCMAFLCFFIPLHVHLYTNMKEWEEIKWLLHDHFNNNLL